MAQCSSRSDLNLCRRGRLGHRSDRDLPEPRTLVRQSRQAIVQSAELGLRSGLDDIVSADGVLGLADPAPAGSLNATNGTDLILCPAGAECGMVLDGRTATYGFGELDTLVPAYAATIHRSQGSEYPAVVIAVMTQHYPMLQRNLLYTGVTRGKKLVVHRRTKESRRDRRPERFKATAMVEAPRQAATETNGQREATNHGGFE